MTRASIRMLLTCTAAALAVSACGEASSDEDAPADMPEGVQEQYALLEEEISEAGGDTTAGQWRIAYIVEEAEPWFEGEQFREPAAGQTHHIEIIPFEQTTGRVVPDVPITLEVIDGGGDVVDSQQLTFLYGEFFHYANNFTIPEPGAYTLRATLEPPTFARHGDEGEQPALLEGAQVEFVDVEL